MFCSVLRDTFTGRAANSDFLVPAADLGTLFPDAAAAFVRDRGGIVRTGVTVRGVLPARDGVDVSVGDGSETFTAAIVAVGPHQLAAALGRDAAASGVGRSTVAQTGAFTYESITTVYLAYAGTVALPSRLARLDDAPGQWAFDRTAALQPAAAGGAQALLAVVISANGPHDALAHSALTAAVDAQLRRLAARLPALVWSRVIAERRATYACAPALARPGAGRIAPGVYLAGDYTDDEFPATLEAATRSGVAAARAVLADLAAGSSRRPGPLP
jgi:hypothetical protein